MSKPSDFTKQIQAERAARSQFKTPGQAVALISHHWDRRVVGKRTIAKVFASGNFTINNRDGTPNPQQYRPTHTGDSAHRTNDSGFSRSEHLEPWTPAIEAEIVTRRKQRLLTGRLDAVAKKLTEMRPGLLTPALIEALEKAVGIEPPAPSPESKEPLTEG